MFGRIVTNSVAWSGNVAFEENMFKLGCGMHKFISYYYWLFLIITNKSPK